MTLNEYTQFLAGNKPMAQDRLRTPPAPLPEIQPRVKQTYLSAPQQRSVSFQEQAKLDSLNKADADAHRKWQANTQTRRDNQNFLAGLGNMANAYLEAPAGLARAAGESMGLPDKLQNLLEAAVEYGDIALQPAKGLVKAGFGGLWLSPKMLKKMRNEGYDAGDEKAIKEWMDSRMGSDANINYHATTKPWDARGGTLEPKIVGPRQTSAAGGREGGAAVYTSNLLGDSWTNYGPKTPDDVGAAYRIYSEKLPQSQVYDVSDWLENVNDPEVLDKIGKSILKGPLLKKRDFMAGRDPMSDLKKLPLPRGRGQMSEAWLQRAWGNHRKNPPLVPVNEFGLYGPNRILFDDAGIRAKKYSREPSQMQPYREHTLFTDPSVIQGVQKLEPHEIEKLIQLEREMEEEVRERKFLERLKRNEER